MYIMCVCLFSALSRRVGALQISIILILIPIIIINNNNTTDMKNTEKENTQRIDRNGTEKYTEWKRTQRNWNWQYRQWKHTRNSKNAENENTHIELKEWRERKQWNWIHIWNWKIPQRMKTHTELKNTENEWVSKQAGK